MNGPAGSGAEPGFFVGWDVGGWNCDHNAQSRDAIVVLDEGGAVAGRPWRGNLRNLINEAGSSGDWIAGLFDLCQAEAPSPDASATMAIDTPLGFSQAFRDLLEGKLPAKAVGKSQDNPYLYRETERYLFSLGRRPLSPIKDMIGSQSTKGLHVLAKFAPKVVSCGVWSDGHRYTAFEGYPSASRDMEVIKRMRSNLPSMPNDDTEDALVCALVARLFATDPECLECPGPEVSEEEGWIWVPKAIPSG